MSKWIMALQLVGHFAGEGLRPVERFARRNVEAVTVIQTDEKGATKHAFGLSPKDLSLIPLMAE